MRAGMVLDGRTDLVGTGHNANGLSGLQTADDAIMVRDEGLTVALAAIGERAEQVVRPELDHPGAEGR